MGAKRGWALWATFALSFILAAYPNPCRSQDSRIQNVPPPTTFGSGGLKLPSAADLLDKIKQSPTLDTLAKDPAFKNDIWDILNALGSDPTVLYLQDTAQKDPALSAALAQRILIAQAQAITRYAELEVLLQLLRVPGDSLALKALVHCVAENLDKLRPVETCKAEPQPKPVGWSRVKAYLEIPEQDMKNDYSIVAKHLNSDYLAFVYTYVGDIRLKGDRFKRVFCKSGGSDECKVGTTPITFQDLGSRFTQVSTEIGAKTGGDCGTTPIPTSIQWNTGLPASAVIDVDRPSFILAFKNTEHCGKLKKAMTGAALSHEVTYVLTILSMAESDTSSLTEEREAIRLAREDLERRYNYWKQNFEVQNLSYEAFVQQAHNRMSYERAQMSALLLSGK